MSGGNHSAAGGSRSDSEHPAIREPVRRFLRLSHILGSVLEEIVDDDLLGTDHPTLSRSQYAFLRLISLNVGLQVGQVARRLGVSAAATSKSLHRLERDGLVQREAVPGDRRAAALAASAEGRRLVRSLERSKLGRVTPAVEDLSDEEREALCELLEKICLGLLERAPDTAGHCLRCAGYFDHRCAIRSRVGGCGFETPARRMT